MKKRRVDVGTVPGQEDVSGQTEQKKEKEQGKLDADKRVRSKKKKREEGRLAEKLRVLMKTKSLEKLSQTARRKPSSEEASDGHAYPGLWLLVKIHGTYRSLPSKD